MSWDLYVGTAGVLPDATAITEWLRQRSLSLVPETIDWNEQSGFLPMRLGGSETGTEVARWGPSMIEGAGLPFEAPRDCAGVVFYCAYREDDFVCALAVGAAIAALADGAIYDPQDAIMLTPDQAIDQAKAILNGLN